MVRRVAPGQPDRVHRDARVATDQRQVARLDRGVGAGAHRDAEVRLGQRGGVVDAVADHRRPGASAAAAATTSATLSCGSTSAITSSIPTSAATPGRGLGDHR